MAVRGRVADQPAAGRHLEPGAQRPHPHHLVERHWLTDPFHLRRSQGRIGKIPLGQRVGRGADHNRPARGQTLQAGRQAGRMPNGHVVRVQIVGADGAQHHVPRVHPDADLQGDAALPPQPLAILRHRLLHAQGRIEGALGVVFMGDRGAKQREDAVAQRLRHIALVAMHRLHHEPQSGIDNVPGFLGVEVFQQRHRPLDVGKQRRDGLALAVRGAACCQGLLLGENAFGQMAGGVGNGAGGWCVWSTGCQYRGRYCRVGCAQALAAGPAKTPAWSDRGAALRAAGFQAGTALFAELVLGWVVTLAVGAAHDAFLLRPRC